MIKEKITYNVFYNDLKKTQIAVEQFVFNDSVFHRPGCKPARIEYWPSGMIKRVEHWVMGKRHCDSGPASTSYEDVTGHITETVYYKDGKLHRDGDLPAVVQVWKDGRTFHAYFKEDNLHRDGDLPGTIIFNKSGDVEVAKWVTEGRVIRTETGPLKDYKLSDQHHLIRPVIIDGKMYKLTEI